MNVDLKAAIELALWALMFALVAAMIVVLLVVRCIGAVAVALFNLPATLLRKGRG